MCEEFIGAFLGIQTLPVCDDGLKISIRLLLITGTKRILGELKLHLLPVDGISGVLNLLLEIRDVRIQASLCRRDPRLMQVPRQMLHASTLTLPDPLEAHTRICCARFSASRAARFSETTFSFFRSSI